MGDSRARRARCSTPEGLHEAVEVSVEDIARINPAVVLDGIAGGAFCATDGFIHPLRHSRGLPVRGGATRRADRVGRRGAWASSATPAAAVNAVRTRTSTIPAGVVVNAAGAWAGDFACACGVDEPVTPLRAPGRAHRAHDGAALVECR